ncbi:hypothetical protein ACFOY2_47530 [Nonomuraea purpurea]|uniref:Uncharacterized protein n=1 Tax=Nonomuraea purpurea TaxID=1849276 RepID=A0ABV8GLW0_9ACTN
MRISRGSAVSLSATGTPVEAYIVFSNGSEEAAPVVAWVTVVSAHDDEEGEADIDISPVVIYDGRAWAVPDLRDEYGARLVLRPVDPSPGD